jgi:hypothetical protein
MCVCVRALRVHMILEICIYFVQKRNVNHEIEVCMYIDLVSD